MHASRFFTILAALAGHAYPQRLATALSSQEVVVYADYSPNSIPMLFHRPTGSASAANVNTQRASFINPALLYDPGTEFKNGSASFDYTSLSPDLKLREGHAELTYQTHGFGASLQQDFNGRGSILALDANGTRTGEKDVKTQSQSLSIAKALPATAGLSHHVGVTLRHVLSPGTYENYGYDRHGYMLDIGYFGKIGECFGLGASVDNLGHQPDVIRTVIERTASQDGSVRISEGYLVEDYPLNPQRINFGMGFGNRWTYRGFGLLGTQINSTYTREFGRKDFGLGRDIFVFETDEELLHTLVSGFGMLHEKRGDAHKFDLGLRFFNHFLIEYSYSNSDRSDVGSQKTFVMEFQNLLSWNGSDARWWRADREPGQTP